LVTRHGFKASSVYKTSKMRKQTINDISAINADQNQFKEVRRDLSVKKNPRYIYTEEDLGEGILDVGVNTSYTADREGNLNPQPWASMLKTYWS